MRRRAPRCEGAYIPGPANFTISPAVLNVNAAGTTYGDSDPALSWTYSGFKSGDTAGTSGISGLASCSRTAGESVGGSPYTITCAPGSLTAPDYSLATGTSANFTIRQRPLTITASNQVKTYGSRFNFAGTEFRVPPGRTSA